MPPRTRTEIRALARISPDVPQRDWSEFDHDAEDKVKRMEKMTINDFVIPPFPDVAKRAPDWREGTSADEVQRLEQLLKENAERQAKSKPKPQPPPQPKPKLQPQPQAPPKPQPKTQPRLEAPLQPKPKPQPKPQVPPKPKAPPNSLLQPQPKARPKPKPKVKPKAQPEPPSEDKGEASDDSVVITGVLRVSRPLSRLPERPRVSHDQEGGDFEGSPSKKQRHNVSPSLR